MRLAVLLAAAVACQAQIISATATFKHFPDASVRAVAGKGKGISAWAVEICNDLPADTTIPRERILMAAPAIHELSGALAQDVLTRRSAEDPHNVFLRILDGALPIVTTGATTYGLVKKQDAVTYSGLSLAAIMLIRAEIARVGGKGRKKMSGAEPGAVLR